VGSSFSSQLLHDKFHPVGLFLRSIGLYTPVNCDRLSIRQWTYASVCMVCLKAFIGNLLKAKYAGVCFWHANARFTEGTL
jgi:hypothetical protein